MGSSKKYSNNVIVPFNSKHSSCNGLPHDNFHNIILRYTALTTTSVYLPPINFR